jgi:hypothetical protein
MLHADESLVMSVPEPDPTDTWQPVSHARIINALDDNLSEMGIGVAHKTYTLSKNGLNVFSLWSLDQQDDGRRLAVGFRNSIDRRLSLGMVGGLNVIVCSNLMFDGEFIEFRRHTKGFTEEVLRNMVAKTVGSVLDHCQRLARWHSGLKEVALPEVDRKVLTYDAMERGILPPSQFSSLSDAYKEEIDNGEGHTLYSFHGANTRVMKGLSLFSVNERNRRLAALCDEYVERVQ